MGKPIKLRITREERKAIFAGGELALKRPKEPAVSEGESLVLAWAGGGKQFLDRKESEREKNEGQTIDVPRTPTLWITFKQPYKRISRDNEVEWVIEYERHDRREPTRLLSGSASGGFPRQSGLKTRASKKPRPRGADIESWSPETERGYGGGKTAIDHLEAVDDATLAEFGKRSRENWEKYRAEARAEKVAEENMRRLFNKMRRLQREALKYGVDLSPQFTEWVAEAQREIVKEKKSRLKVRPMGSI